MKSCCIRDYCGKPFDTGETETRDTRMLRLYWWMYCPEHRALPAGEYQEILVNQPVKEEQSSLRGLGGTMTPQEFTDKMLNAIQTAMLMKYSRGAGLYARILGRIISRNQLTAGG